MSAPLSAEQRAAAHAAAPTTLIQAGPGTGKTEVLAARVAHFVEAGSDPAGIVLVTFTIRAAAEMRARIRAYLGARADRVWAGTFHALAHALLRRHGDRIGLAPGWTVVDRDTQTALMAKALAGLGPTPLAPGRWLEVAGWAINGERSGAETAAHWQLAPDAVEAVFDAYAAEKAAEHRLDYDDLLLLAKSLLFEHGPQAPGERPPQHVLVDEFQDTTRLQAEIAVHLAPGATFTAVGDDAQSIYGFRGAEVRFIRALAAQTEARFALTESHRCPPAILAVASALAARDPDTLGTALRSSKGPGPRPALVAAPDPETEGRFVARRIQDHLLAGLPASEIAVLYRTHAVGKRIAGPLEAAGLTVHRRSPDDEAPAERQPSGEAVTLATVHQAKGQEWTVVFVVGLAEPYFPLGRALEVPGGLAEERRLLYVAVTRAREALYLSHPTATKPGGTPLGPCRYLFEVPEGLLDPWSLA